MSKGIKISPQHGLNPTIPVCMFCGKEKNEVALLGKIGGRNEDIEAPRSMILDYEPCDECKEKIGDGILVIGVAPRNGQNIMPIMNDLVPTGTWCAMTEEAVIRIFDMDGKNAAMRDAVIKTRRLLVDNEILADILDDFNKQMEEEE